MVIPEVVLFSLRKIVSVFSLAPFAPPIFPHEPNQKDSAADRCEPLEGQRGPEPKRKGRSLARDVDIAGNHTAEITESNLQGGPDTFLVMAAEIVVQPHESERHGDIPTGLDHVNGDVSNRHRETMLS